MVMRGPCRLGGAWTLHLLFNEAVHVPEMREEDREKAKTWLHNRLAAHLGAQLQREFSKASGDGSKEQHQHEAFRLCRAFLKEGGDFSVHLRQEESEFTRWLVAATGAHPTSRCVVTAVQRQARSGDLYVAVRHPITQSPPVMRLIVDKMRRGFALGVPPMFANLSELDYDGDKMKIASERAPRRRSIWEEHLSPAKLMHDPLGRKIVRLSGVAPLALNLAQSAGLACPNPFLLATDPVDSVVWRGVLEPVVSLKVFLNGLAAIGCARPDMLAERWSQPCFKEVRFRVQKGDGAWQESTTMGISYDGYYPVPAMLSSNMQSGWIAAELMRRQSLMEGCNLTGPVRVEIHHGSGCSSALDDLTFAQMRSLTQAFTPKNFRKDGSDRISVQHLPGLVHHGSFQTYANPQMSAWLRMSRVLLRLAARPRRAQHAPEKRKGPPPACIRGNDAILAELVCCRWRPSEKDVVACVLELDRVTKGGLLATLYRETMGLGRLEDLSVALQDRKAIECLAQDHELFDRCSEKAGFAKAAQMLRRFCFEHSSPPYKKLRDKLPLNVSTAAELWRQLDLSELLQVGTEESTASEAETEPRQLKIRFKEGRMDDAHWKDLAEKAQRTVRALHKPLPLLKRRASRGYFTLKDWGRLVAAIVVPQRQTLDVEASLEHLSSLWNDDAEYCASLAALDALGHTLANLLNQPTQNEALVGHLHSSFSSQASKSKIALDTFFSTVRSSWKKTPTILRQTLD